MSLQPTGESTEWVIRTQDLSRHYAMGNHTVNALREVNLAVKAGEFVALMGTSGSGKSTLLHLLGCLDRPTSGKYWLEGTETSSLNRKALASIRGERIGFVFQNFNLLPRLSAWENVALPLAYRKGQVNAKAQHVRAMEALVRVGLEERADHNPMELSGGERQRVAIARALVTHPAVVLADEPTGNLDSATGKEIMALLDELHAAGCTLVIVTHDLAIGRHASRICTLQDGRLQEGETTHDSR